MILSRIVYAATLCLGIVTAAGCADQPDVAVSDQAIGSQPACPVGQTVINWYEVYGVCGSCTTPAGQLALQYAACSGNVEGTTKLINNRACAPGCSPL